MYNLRALRKNKTQKFADIQISKNVIEPDKPIFSQIKGKWHNYFDNEYEIIVELACGWGEYTIGLAELFPEKNFIGIDVKGDRIWKGSQYAIENNLNNVAFLRIHITEILSCFGENELSEIWLTFPDPRPKDRDEKHRLSNLNFLKMYRHILKPDGWFRFKTDNTDLFEYSLDVLDSINTNNLSYTFDLYKSDLLDEHFGVKTKYEKIWTERGEKIKYLKFQFRNS